MTVMVKHRVSTGTDATTNGRSDDGDDHKFAKNGSMTLRIEDYHRPHPLGNNPASSSRRSTGAKVPKQIDKIHRRRCSGFPQRRQLQMEATRRFIKP